MVKESSEEIGGKAGNQKRRKEMDQSK